jgi:hypothetical protein
MLGADGLPDVWETAIDSELKKIMPRPPQIDFRILSSLEMPKNHLKYTIVNVRTATKSLYATVYSVFRKVYTS